MPANSAGSSCTATSMPAPACAVAAVHRAKQRVSTQINRERRGIRALYTSRVLHAKGPPDQASASGAGGDLARLQRVLRPRRELAERERLVPRPLGDARVPVAEVAARL